MLKYMPLLFLCLLLTASCGDGRVYIGLSAISADISIKSYDPTDGPYRANPASSAANQFISCIGSRQALDTEEGFFLEEIYMDSPANDYEDLHIPEPYAPPYKNVSASETRLHGRHTLEIFIYDADRTYWKGKITTYEPYHHTYSTWMVNALCKYWKKGGNHSGTIWLGWD